MHRQWRGAVVSIAAWLLILGTWGCGPKARPPETKNPPNPEKLIVGTWKPTDGGQPLTFSAELSVTEKESGKRGTYQTLDFDMIMITLPQDPGTDHTVKYLISDNELVIHLPKGPKKFERVR